MTDQTNADDFVFQTVTLDDPKATCVVVNGEDGKPGQVFYSMEAMAAQLSLDLANRTMMWAVNGSDENTRYMLMGETGLVKHIIGQRNDIIAQAQMQHALDHIGDFFPGTE
jgi:hypothetical protein